MKNLVLITSNFPFGTGEPFIETEFPFLHTGFDRVVIISQNPSSGLKRDLPEDVSVYRYDPATSLKGFLLLPVLATRNIKLILSAWREELSFRSKIEFKLSIWQKLLLLRKIIKAVQLRDFINDVLESEQISTNVIFYSFWMNSGAHAISLLEGKSCLRISRAQASDLYEEKSILKFLPLLKYTTDRLDAVFFPSDHAKSYFMNKTGTGEDHLRISRLGVSRKFPLNKFTSDQKAPFLIISCSNLIPLKRIDLLIESLELIASARMIRWIHFGDGPLQHVLEKLAAKKLGEMQNLSYEFRGYVENQEILKFYSTNKVDLFINTSSTEGTPVSIMEAQSYGIPVIATDVGAVSEQVNRGTGSLMPVDFEPVDLAQLIRHYMEIPQKQTEEMRKVIIRHWETHYNAEINYPDFISQVISIFDSSTEGTGETK